MTPRKKLALAAVALMLTAAIGLAQTVGQGWDYCRAKGGSLSSNPPTTSTLTLITTTPDTSCVYYFNDLIPYLTVWMRHAAKNATLTSMKIPLIQYKVVDYTGKFFTPDSGNGWIKLADSSHTTITAADSTFQYKTLDLRAVPGAYGVVFKGTSTAESTQTVIKVSGVLPILGKFPAQY